MRYGILLVFVFYCLHSDAQNVSPRVRRELDTKQEVPVLIVMKRKADLSSVKPAMTKKEKAQLVFHLLCQEASQSQQNISQLLHSLQVPFHNFYIINAIAARINQQQLTYILQHPEVGEILLDETISLEPTQDRSVINLQARGPVLTWGLERIEADKVWQMGFEGQGVTVAGEDTGYKWDLEGIKEKYRGYQSGNNVDHNYNWHDAIHTWSHLSPDSTGNRCGYNLRQPCDDNDHGTHTMGTMVGSAATDAHGVAPRANWIGCRNMERGNGALSTYVECFEFFLAPTDLDNKNPKPELAPSVINNSWYCALEEGCDASNFAIMEEVVDHLTMSGVVVVVSAGNSGQSCGNINAPAAIYESSFVVGAFAPDDQISGFSSSGPVLNYKTHRIKPDVAAPGSQVISRIPSGDLVAWNGTSMAGPHVAGLVALVINANPSLDGQVDKIKDIIERAARPADANIDCPPFAMNTVPNHVYGYGKIMASRAVQMAILLGNQDQSTSSLEIYPNPASSELLILNADKNDAFVVTDLYGKNQACPRKNDNTIDISMLTQGVYIISNPVRHLEKRFIKL